MTDDREHEAKMRAMEAIMASELAEVTRIGPPVLTQPVTVRYEPCIVCRGDGWIETRLDRDGFGIGRQCCYCGGSGRVCVEVSG